MTWLLPTSPVSSSTPASHLISKECKADGGWQHALCPMSPCFAPTIPSARNALLPFIHSANLSDLSRLSSRKPPLDLQVGLSDPCSTSFSGHPDLSLTWTCELVTKVSRLFISGYPMPGTAWQTACLTNWKTFLGDDIQRITATY